MVIICLFEKKQLLTKNKLNDDKMLDESCDKGLRYISLFQNSYYVLYMNLICKCNNYCGTEMTVQFLYFDHKMYFCF